MIQDKELTVEEIATNIDAHINDISKEFRTGFEFLRKYNKSVTVFGSSRLTAASSHYNDARHLCKRIVSELKYSIITGGGPGIMEAANWGAKEAGGDSLGLTINIPQGQHTNEYSNQTMAFDYFFTRKTMLNFSAEAYVFFPGGYGTFDELFGVLTLIQTKKIPRVPIILFGKDYWNPFKEFLTTIVFNEHHAVDAEDLELFVITDSSDEVIKIIKGAPVSSWWKLLD